MGDTWADISSNLPDTPANDIIVDPTATQTLFLGTDIGVYGTVDGGANWFPLGLGMPIQTVFDLTLHSASRTLVAATHGRSQWKLDLTDLLAVSPTEPVARLALSAPHPNPSRGVAHLSLELTSTTTIEIDVYDTMGRRVRSLARRSFEPGRHAISWDGSSEEGRRVRPGVYFIHANAGGASDTERIVRVD
jgi:hypothetical protein